MGNDKNDKESRPSIPPTSKSWMQMLEKASGKPFVIKKQKIEEKQQKHHFSSHAILLIDCSGSMAGNNLRQAKDGAYDFADEAIKKDYKIGIVSFSHHTNKLIDPTNDSSKIQSALQKIEPESTTVISEALLMGIEMIHNQSGQRVLTLVTDGRPTEDPEISIRIADEAKSKGIEIITIGTDDADLDYLRRLASRKELASHVDNQHLAKSIAGLAGLLSSSDKC